MDVREKSSNEKRLLHRCNLQYHPLDAFAATAERRVNDDL